MLHQLPTIVVRRRSSCNCSMGVKLNFLFSLYFCHEIFVSVFRTVLIGTPRKRISSKRAPPSQLLMTRSPFLRFEFNRVRPTWSRAQSIFSVEKKDTINALDQRKRFTYSVSYINLLFIKKSFRSKLQGKKIFIYNRQISRKFSFMYKNMMTIRL